MRLAAIIVLGIASMLPGRAGATANPPATPVSRADVPAAGTGGRLVFAVRDRASVTQTRTGNDLVLVPALPLLRSSGGPAQGIIEIENGARRTVIHLQPGAAVRTVRGAGRMTFDVIVASAEVRTVSPPVTAPVPARQASAPASDGVLPGLPASMIAVVDPPRQPQAVGSSPVPSSAATPGPTPSASDGGRGSTSPVSIEAALVSSPQGRPAELLLPFDRAVGAAAFQRAGRLEIVFDSRKPIDLSLSAGDPAFRDAHVSLLPAGTLLDMPSDPAQPMTLTRVVDGWLLRREAPAVHPVSPEPLADGLVFAMPTSGQVLTVPDPCGGGDLMVGTVRSGAANVVATGRAPGYRIVPTLLGVAIERISDRVELRPLSNGFRLIDPFPPTGGYSAVATTAFSRTVDLSPVDRAEQWRRYKDALATSASLPSGARRGARLEAARSAFALGFGSETRRLAQIADQDAPDGAGRSRSAFLIGAGALLAGDPDSAQLLADPLIGNSDEAVLWRNLAAAQQDPSDSAALRSVAALWPLLLSYPDAVKRQIVGDVAMAIARNGNGPARALVAALPGDTGKVALARALLDTRPDNDRNTLVTLDHLSADPDPDVALSAGRQAIELRLDHKLIAPTEAARRMERLIYDGRMAGRETEVAIRAAQLRAQSQDWPSALAILRQQARLYPGNLPQIQSLAGDVLGRAVVGGSATDVAGSAKPGETDPLPVIGLLEQNQDLLPADADRAGLTVKLADRLVARDLPGFATGFLRRAIDQSPPGPDKARLGLALARALLQQDDVPAARATLDVVDRAGLPPALAEQRALLNARLLSAGGDRQGAIAALAPLSDADSVELRAAMLGDSKDWQGEAKALATLLSLRQPSGPTGKPLDPRTEDVVLRLAGSLSRSAQPDAVRRLAQNWSGSFADPAKRDMLSLLASPDVTSVGDLSRSASDITAARTALKVLDGS